MKALIHYLDYINHRRSLFGYRRVLDLYNDCGEVRIELEALGAPEILAGDGEYTREETEARTSKWIDAMLELEQIEAELTA